MAADPLENFNETSFEVIQSVDKAFVGPVAIAYREKIPGPMRKGVRNFLSNIGEPIAFVNFVLQLKIGKAAETVGRFGINSTLGVAGLFDVAKKKPFYLPHRVNGFAYTMGFYGIKSGPYLYLPFIGPTTLRDVTGRLMDLSLLPFTIGAPFNNLFYAVPAGILSSLDDRAEFDDELQRLRTETNDPYAALRAYYLNRRQAEIDAACELIDFLRFNVYFLSEIYKQQPISGPGMHNRLEYRALEGFVLAVTPFNFTAIGGNLPASAALCGNTVVWKCANTQVYSASMFMKIMKEAGLPDGVINLVYVDGPTLGEVCFKHPFFAGVHFTGSTGVFNQMWKTIGEQVSNYRSYPRIVGETGGKDFVMVHPSADPDVVVT
ncbi:MAG: aldehyde dehydrogenase family protein, partial [Sphingomonadaceae bacterium]|nr:aldehyde dehydrogenase family protein [Sphingomonadaceae bacterium]